MRELLFYDYAGRLLPDANARLIALVAYPNDEKSRDLYTDYLNQQAARYFSSKEKYEVSRFEEKIYRLHQKSEGQKAIAGLVTLFFYLVKTQTGNLPTLYQASKLAEQHIAAVKTEKERPLGVPYFNGSEIEIEHLRTVSGAENIGNRFREYNCIGTITAARLAYFVEGKEPMELSVPTNTEHVTRETCNILWIANQIENGIFPDANKYFDNPWLVSSGSFVPEWSDSGAWDRKRLTEFFPITGN